MVVTDFQRGHKIYYNVYKKEWRYVSDDAPAKIEKRCIRCLRYPLKDGEDYCLGHMEGVKSACCGHGIEKGFIILNDGRRFEEITYDEVKEGYEHHLSELQGLNEILTKENEKLKEENIEITHDRLGLEEDVDILLKENEVLKKENEELKASKEYWKGECLSNGSLNQILTNELNIAQKEGYEPTNSFKQHISDW